jgi:hypothetical protein
MQGNSKDIVRMKGSSCQLETFFSLPHKFQLSARERDRTKTAIKIQSKGIFKRHQEEEEPRGEERARIFL